MLESSLRTIATLAAVLRAAVRVGYLEPRTSLPELVVRLRDTRTTTRPSRESRSRVHADPGRALGLVDAMLPLLPPYGAGRCMKRSLLLLDIWSRAGLSPSLHLGIRGVSGARTGPGAREDDCVRSGHAWVETVRSEIRTFRAPDVIEAWRA